MSPDFVRKVAALARLSVPDSELSIWTEQLGRIVSYIDQLKQLSGGPDDQAQAAATSLQVRTPATPLRADQAVSGGGLQALQENARLVHDHGVVPRVVGGS